MKLSTMSIKSTIIIAIIFCAVCSFVAGLITYKITNGNWQTKYDNHIIEDNQKRDSYLSKIRDLESKISKEQQKVEDNAKLLQDKYENDLRTANDVAERLREKIRDLSASRNSQNTGVNREFAAAATDSTVYLWLFERADRTAGELAEYADRVRTAGITCENNYKALYNSYHF